jgi:hypothetical protein
VVEPEVIPEVVEQGNLIVLLSLLVVAVGPEGVPRSTNGCLVIGDILVVVVVALGCQVKEQMV